MEKNPIIFLAAPNSLGDDMQYENETFKVDPAILLPVELEQPEPGSPEQNSGKLKLDPEKLSWETNLSGMLKIISACGKKNRITMIGDEKSDLPKSSPAIKRGDVIYESGMDGISDRIPDEWIDYYRRFILTVKPEIYHEFTGATIVKAGNGEFDLALEINSVLEGLFPGSPGVLLNKALLLEDRAADLEKNGHEAAKETAMAKDAYETALSAVPVLPDTFFNAGFFFMRQRDFVRAKDCFSRYISLGEESEIIKEIPAEKMKQAKKIIGDINNQGLDDSSFREAYDCINQGKDEKGLLKIREFIEKYPRVWNGWFTLGWVLRKLGRYADSLEALKKTVELGGNNCDILNEKAICHMELGDLKGARKELENALRKEPENIKIISNLGVLAMKIGKKDEAAAFFRTVLELDGNDPLAKNFLDKI